MQWQATSFARLRQKWAGVPIAAARARAVDGRAEDVLFLGHSADASFYHRVMLPATALGCDWCGLDSPPPRMIARPRRGPVRRASGPDLGALPHRRRADAVRGGLARPRPRAPGRRDEAVALRRRLLPCTRSSTDAEVLDRIEALLAACDGVTLRDARTSRERYARFNPRTFVCENGIDLKAVRADAARRTTRSTSAGPARPRRVEEMLPWLAQIAGDDARPGRDELRQHRPAARRRGRGPRARSRPSAASRSRACCPSSTRRR